MNLYFYNKNQKQNQIDGALFDGITSNWKKVFKTGLRTDSEKDIEVISYMVVGDDKDNLQDDLFVEIVIKEGRKTIYKSEKATFRHWKNGIELPKINNKSNWTLSLIFFTFDMPENKSGKSSHFDFEFGIRE